MLWTDEIPRPRHPEADAQRGHEAARLRLLSHAGAGSAGRRPALPPKAFEAVFPYDPTRNDPRWLDFNRRFEARFHEQPEQFASLAYDAMNALLDSICKAGLNRARIHDALADIEKYDGVTGHMVFDPNQKNVAPMYLGTVHNGAITYRVATMEKVPAVQDSGEATPPIATTITPYARVGEDGVNYNGPQIRRLPRGPVRVVLFGLNAAAVAHLPEVLATIRAGSTVIGRGSCCRWRADRTGARHLLNWFMR